MRDKRIIATICAVLAALLYAIYIPASKLLLEQIEPAFLASFLYLGAGLGIGVLYFIAVFRKKRLKMDYQETTYPIRSE